MREEQSKFYELRNAMKADKPVGKIAHRIKRMKFRSMKGDKFVNDKWLIKRPSFSKLSLIKETK